MRLFFPLRSLLSRCRCLASSIQFLTEYLCAYCLGRKSKVSDLGTKLDKKRHINLRVDSEDRQGMIATARRWIFEKGTAVLGAVISRFLQYGVTPIIVRFWNDIRSHGETIHDLTAAKCKYDGVTMRDAEIIFRTQSVICALEATNEELLSNINTSSFLLEQQT